MSTDWYPFLVASRHHCYVQKLPCTPAWSLTPHVLKVTLSITVSYHLQWNNNDIWSYQINNRYGKAGKKFPLQRVGFLSKLVCFSSFLRLRAKGQSSRKATARDDWPFSSAPALSFSSGGSVFTYITGKGIQMQVGRTEVGVPVGDSSEEGRVVEQETTVFPLSSDMGEVTSRCKRSKSGGWLLIWKDTQMNHAKEIRNHCSQPEREHL